MNIFTDLLDEIAEENYYSKEIQVAGTIIPVILAPYLNEYYFSKSLKDIPTIKLDINEFVKLNGQQVFYPFGIYNYDKGYIPEDGEVGVLASKIIENKLLIPIVKIVVNSKLL